MIPGGERMPLSSISSACACLCSWSEFSAASLVGGIELAVERKRKTEREAAEGTGRRETTGKKNEAAEEGRG